MEFVHKAYIPGETIAAIATAPGDGGIAIIRISGKEAITIAAKMFSGPVAFYKTHTAHYGFVLDGKGQRIDEALLLIMLGKRSYSGEDTVELQCHGGMIACRKVLARAIEAGARPAGPGEFTFKAFMNGKLDLAQAEAVQQLICAKNERAFAAAGEHLDGRLSSKISDYQKQLVDIAAILEAWVDFPEEGLEFASMEEVCLILQHILDSMRKLLATFEEGRKIHQGLNVCIIGAPNAGKSSLMNALLEKERAIVTPIAGTTRDILEDEMFLNGLNLRLVDTAGIRDAEEMIEKEGIRRSKLAMQAADLILFVLDATRSINADEKQLFANVQPEKTIFVWNKIDLDILDITIPLQHSVKISAKNRLGIDELLTTIDRVIWHNSLATKDEVVITSIRHKNALHQAIQSVENVLTGLQREVSPEFLMIDMRTALQELGLIIGTNISEDILSSIFSHFCIGK